MFNLGLKVSDGEFHGYHRREDGSRQARTALEKKLRAQILRHKWESCGFFKSQASHSEAILPILPKLFHRLVCVWGGDV